MTDAEAFQHIIDVAKKFSDTIMKDFPETTDLRDIMLACSKHIIGISIAREVAEDRLTTATAIVGLALLLNRKDQVDKITLVNATNVKN